MRSTSGRILLGLALIGVAGAVGYGARHLSLLQGATQEVRALGTGAFVLLGLLIGVSHCVGMCWPFVLYVSSRHASPRPGGLPRVLPHLYYNLGRTLTYTALGALSGWAGGLIGAGGSLLGVQRAAAVLAGALLTLYGLLGLLGIYTPLNLGGLAPIRRLTERVMAGKPRPLVLGLILGLLPCGPLYGALLAAAALGNPWEGAVALLLFGLGTVPALLAISFLGNFLARRRDALRILSFVLVLVMGVFFVWHGVTADPPACHPIHQER